MADEKISAMPAAATLTGSELVPLVQSGGNVKSTVAAVAALAPAAPAAILVESGAAVKSSAMTAAASLTGTEVVTLVQSGGNVKSTVAAVAALAPAAPAALLVESGAAEKISASTAAATLTGTELLPLVQGGANVQTTAQAVANLAAGGGAPAILVESGSAQKISAMTQEFTLTGEEIVPVLVSGVNKKIQISEIQTFIDALTTINGPNPVSGFPAASLPLSGSEILYISQSGLDNKTTTAAIANASAIGVYRAYLSQSGTNPPVATVFENTLGTITWQYLGPGYYVADIPGNPGQNKVWIGGNANINNIQSNQWCAFAVYSAPPMQIHLTTFQNPASPSYIDGILAQGWIEIRVYP